MQLNLRPGRISRARWFTRRIRARTTVHVDGVAGCLPWGLEGGRQILAQMKGFPISRFAGSSDAVGGKSASRRYRSRAPSTSVCSPRQVRMRGSARTICHRRCSSSAAESSPAPRLELTRGYEPTAQSIGSWVRQAEWSIVDIPVELAAIGGEIVGEGG